MKINEDLVRDIEAESDQSTKFLDYQDEGHYCNVWARKEIQEEKDFSIITKDLWEFFTS
jgi:hypothetical protein